MRLVETLLGRLGLYDRVAQATHRVRKPQLAEWNRQVFAFHRPLIERGALVFDIGANDGRLTRIFLRLGAAVVAVEPNPALAETLARRYPRASVRAVAVGAADGEGDLHLAAADVLATLSSEWVEITRREGIPTEWTGETVHVPIVTLDTLIAEYGLPDYVKIDVEGYEPHVLSGLSRPVQLVSFEFQAANPTATAECVRLLDQLGRYEYRVTVLDELRFRSDWTTGAGAVDQVEQAVAAEGVTASGDVFARLS